MKTTRIQINALTAVLCLTGMATLLAFMGEYCGAVGLAGTVGVVAVHFAKIPNGD